MSKDVAVDSSSTHSQEISDPAELFYADTTEAESSPDPEEDSSPSPETSKEVEETESASDPETETEESEEPVTRDEKGRFKSGAAKRIAELLAENKQLKQERAKPADAPKTEAPKTEAKVEALKEPVPGDFETWDAFTKANNDFLQKKIDAQVKDAIAKDRAEQSRHAEEQKQKDELAKQHELMVERQKQTEKRIPDLKKSLFDEAGHLREDFPIHPVFDNFIPRSEVGWDILHHIATHPEEASKIAGMDEFSAAAEFYRLQSDITAKLQTPPKKETPRPARTLAGTASTVKVKTPEEAFYGDD